MAFNDELLPVQENQSNLLVSNAPVAPIVPSIDTEPMQQSAAEPTDQKWWDTYACLLYTSPSPRDRTRSRMPSSA